MVLSENNLAAVNRCFQNIFCFSLLPAGVKSIGIEVYDECALTVDELIAYGQVTIPEAVFNMEAVEDWYPLSGKQGENKEGSIHLIMTLMVNC